MSDTRLAEISWTEQQIQASLQAAGALGLPERAASRAEVLIRSRALHPLELRQAVWMLEWIRGTADGTRAPRESQGLDHSKHDIGTLDHGTPGPGRPEHHPQDHYTHEHETLALLLLELMASRHQGALAYSPPDLSADEARNLVAQYHPYFQSARNYSLDEGQLRDIPAPFVLHSGPNFYLERNFRAEFRIRRHLENPGGFFRKGLPPPGIQDTNQVSSPGLPAIFREILVEKALQLPGHSATGHSGTGQRLRLHSRQALALVCACLQPLSIISGGPGTGKTTVVTQILRALLRLHPEIRSDQIALAAPTGRAAARMAESLKESLASLGADLRDFERPLLSLEGRTLHRLLGLRPGSDDSHHGPDNPLPYRLVVIDESSMLDVFLFSSLLEALHPSARLILLGDREQLPSVESGAVLGDLTGQFYHSDKRSSLSAAFLRQAQESLPPEYWSEALETEGPDCWQGALVEPSEAKHRLLDRCVILTRSHRFSGDIGRLAEAFRRGQTSAAWQVLESPGQDAACSRQKGSWAEILESWAEGFSANWAQLCQACGEEWEQHLARATVPSVDPSPALFQSPHGNQSQDPFPHSRKLLEALGQSRILSPLRRDPQGLEAINRHLSAILAPRWDRRFNTPGRPLSSGAPFHGLPLMVTENNHDLGIFNGDTGVWVWVQGQYRALLARGNEFLLLPPSRVKAWEAAFAITVHKSQGSEYQKVLLMMPQALDDPLLTREILFTALTRARREFRIAGLENPEALEAILARTIQRPSGLRPLVEGL